MFYNQELTPILQFSTNLATPPVQGLAVDSDDAAPAPVQGASRKGLRKGAVVKRPEYRPESLGRGDAALERQKTAPPVQLRPGEINFAYPVACQSYCRVRPLTTVEHFVSRC